MKKLIAIALILTFFSIPTHIGFTQNTELDMRGGKGGSGGKKGVTHTTSGTVALSCSNSGKVLTNSGATQDITFGLEAAATGNEGCNFTFVQTNTTYDIYVDPNASDQFRGMYSTNANGDRLKGDKVEGSLLNIICIKDNAGVYRWFTSGSGAWADAN